MTAIDTALPPLALTIRRKNDNGENEFIADPIQVAKIHSDPWANEWGAYDPDFQINFAKLFEKCGMEISKAQRFTPARWTQALSGYGGLCGNSAPQRPQRAT